MAEKSSVTSETGEAAADTPETREQMASKLVDRFALWSGVAGLVPVPVLDAVAVGGLQIQMVRRISQIYDVDFSENRGKALIASLAGSMIPATSGIGAASVLKAIPVIGTIAGGFVMPALSAGATYAIQDHRVRVAQSQASESEQIKQVLGASDAKVASGQIDGGNVVVVTSAALDKSVVVVKSLPTPGSQAYQLWMAFGGEARSIGVLPAGASSAIRLIPDTNGASAFMISREPPGGSATPTTVVGQLTMA